MGTASLAAQNNLEMATIKAVKQETTKKKVILDQTSRYHRHIVGHQLLLTKSTYICFKRQAKAQTRYLNS